MRNNDLPVVVFVAGYLGSGKTTLLLAAGKLLRERGLRAGIVTNDQGGELVDTQFLARSGFPAAEVSGGCFCCRFSDFLARAEQLLSTGPQVILAEPVGSCTDLSATILQPLKKFYRERLRLAPLTVLVDPVRAAEMLAEGEDSLLAYLFRKQIEEADTVWYSKADLEPTPPAIEGVFTRRLSARTGEGVEEWLAEVLNSDLPAGSRLLEVDYSKYAAAEAALGWLNWRATLRARPPLSPVAAAGMLLDGVDARLTQAGIRIAHLKVISEARTGWLKASICRNGAEPVVDGDRIASPAGTLYVTLNLRAVGDPAAMIGIVTEEAAKLPARAKITHLEAFRPAAPRPELRMTELV